MAVCVEFETEHEKKCTVWQNVEFFIVKPGGA